MTWTDERVFRSSRPSAAAGPRRRPLRAQREAIGPEGKGRLNPSGLVGRSAAPLVRSSQPDCLRRAVCFQGGRAVARQALDMVAVGFRAGQSDHSTLRSLHRVDGDQEMVATRADVSQLSLHLRLPFSFGRPRQELIAAVARVRGSCERPETPNPDASCGSRAGIRATSACRGQTAADDAIPDRLVGGYHRAREPRSS